MERQLTCDNEVIGGEFKSCSMSKQLVETQITHGAETINEKQIRSHSKLKHLVENIVTRLGLHSTINRSMFEISHHWTEHISIIMTVMPLISHIHHFTSKIILNELYILANSIAFLCGI